MEFTLLMPCLDEKETLATCIRKAHKGAAEAGMEGYEVLIADNGSTDGSVEIAVAEGARVVHVGTRGYGAALRGGIASARGDFLIMGDADDSYDWSSLKDFVRELRAGHDVVMGTRLKGEIKPGAMPPLHKYLGNPVLTFLGNLFYKTGLSDFHCGLRGFRRSAINSLDLKTTGMEFASEMVIRSAEHDLKRTEVPITLHPDGRSRPPHLRTWRDGWRHLRFMLLHSPRWLFLYPGLFAMLFGGIFMVTLLPGVVNIGSISFDLNSLLIGAMVFLAGTYIVSTAIVARTIASRLGVLSENEGLERRISNFSLEIGLIVSLILIILGLAVVGAAIIYWAKAGFGELDYQVSLRMVIPGVTLLLLGLQGFFLSFLLSLLTLQATAEPVEVTEHKDTV